MDEYNYSTLFKIMNYLKSLNCDVICLQEVLYHQFQLMKLLLKMNGEFALHKKMKFGICILTKYNIKEINHILLTSKKEQRGLLSFDFNDRTIINTHLGLDKEERNTQISEIMDFAKTRKKDIILCGDFNEKNIDINCYKDIAKIFNKDFQPTFRKYRIDYIFVDKKIKPISYKVDEVAYSDHFPIICEI